ncbi:hypothetical protein [Mesorhizobium sp. YR577]|uniref:hypothetical protein n=1 Tax=Mesorhizobium sp. YR577 TaxID=1884373 RepID=UPI0015879BAD|nr:hypothetical protein [Mesorhizobium sp. YR577]
MSPLPVTRCTLHKAIPLESLDHTVEILPRHDEVVTELPERDAVRELPLGEGAEEGPLHRGDAELLYRLPLQFVAQLEEPEEQAVVELVVSGVARRRPLRRDMIDGLRLIICLSTTTNGSRCAVRSSHFVFRYSIEIIPWERRRPSGL